MHDLWPVELWTRELRKGAEFLWGELGFWQSDICLASHFKAAMRKGGDGACVYFQTPKVAYFLAFTLKFLSGP